MGYPVVTRIGLSQFWYKHWQPDLTQNSKENIQQDVLFETLIEAYLNYGFTWKINPFFHEYWYSKLKLLKLHRTKFNPSLSKFYRRFYYANNILSIEHSFFIRHKVGEYFPLRIWFLKYLNWVIISFKCFKPIKLKKRVGEGKRVKSSFLFSINTNSANKLGRSNLNRSKLFFIFFKKSVYTSLKLYNF